MSKISDDHRNQGNIVAGLALRLGEGLRRREEGGQYISAQRVLTNAPWMAIGPGRAIFLVVLSFNLVGDGRRDALDPRQR